ncbi:type II toxin-antitoxin system HicB family antitoxin [Desulfonema magnum]|uniref:type II toxin-antitoxin system HicB family antitoxin n=1 Tax=Desulfonema magnum TaxID=45655 RepID=UPI001A9BABF5|nr:type II toxin-antitoxin system HicB family antitoxin [Desulfonema magnum]
MNDFVTFEGDNVADLKKAFEEAVDHYVSVCEKLARDPQKTFRGKFNVRIKPELHRKASLVAFKKNISLNKLVETAINNEIGKPEYSALAL